MRWWCQACRKEFDAEESSPRCPTCLRKTSVVEASARQREGAVRRRGGLRPLGLAVAIVVLAPYMTVNMLSWHLPWWVTFLVALAAFAAGHGVDWLVARRKPDNSNSR